MKYILLMLLFVSFNCEAQIAYISSGHATSGNNTTVITTTTTIGATAIHVAISYYRFSFSVVPLVSDNQGSTWVQDTIVTVAGDASIVLYHCSVCGTGASHTFSTSVTTEYPSIVVLATSGEKAAGAKDLATGKTVVGSLSCCTTITAPTMTPSENNEIVISVINPSNQAPTISTAGFTTLYATAGGASWAGIGMAYNIQSSATAVATTWTWSGNNSTQVMIQDCFKKALSTAKTGLFSLLLNQ